MFLRYFGSAGAALVPTFLVFLTLASCAQQQDAALDGGERAVVLNDVTVETTRAEPEPNAKPRQAEQIMVFAQKQGASSAAVAPDYYYAPPPPVAVTAFGAGSGIAAVDYGAVPYEGYPVNTENYAEIEDNPVKQAVVDPVSTFSIDVDTGAYSNTRRFLNSGQMPPSDAVRIEELVNYFDYAYAPPRDRKRPFAVHADVAKTPWNRDTYLLKVGLKGYEVPQDSRPAANLVFLLDVSGSMDYPDKLPLLVSSMKLLVNQLRADDTVSIVVYAGAAGVVLEPTSGTNKAAIREALDRLQAGGSTAGSEGIQLAYAVAKKAFIKKGINRIILATDGDFNVGTVRVNSLKHYVASQRDSGVSLSILGFGIGNLNDEMVEQLADVGNGAYSYIDTLKEGRKVLVEQVASTLQTIAKDTKIQIEFNPVVVAEYRLIGYTNRVLAREDFNNDKVDAGDIGAGHTVTALYEIALVGSKGLQLDPLRHASRADDAEANPSEFAFLKLRYKLPDEDESTLIEVPLQTSMLKAAGDPDGDFRFAAAVAAFGEKLRGGKFTGELSYGDIASLAEKARGDDRFGYRSEFLELVRMADALSPSRQSGLE